MDYTGCSVGGSCVSLLVPLTTIGAYVVYQARRDVVVVTYIF